MPFDGQYLLAAAAAWLTSALPNALAALAFVLVGFWLARFSERMMLKVMDRQQGDATLRGVLGSGVRYTIMLVALIAALGQLGFQTSSILAVLATAGLAIGLALQATLANIAAGIMLLWLRPFRVGDNIEVGAISGKVVEVGLFASELHTSDGLYQFVPNAELWNKRLTNFSRLPRRLVSVRLAVPPNLDVLVTLRSWLEEEALRDSRILAEPPPTATVAEIGHDRVVLTVQAWVATEHYPAVHRDLSDRLPQIVLQGRDPG